MRPLLLSLLATAAVGQQSAPPTAVEVVGEARAPSAALLAQILKDHDELVLFDTGFGIRDAVVQLQCAWWDLEWKRAKALADLLAAMSERWRKTALEGPARDCAGVAVVAGALLFSDGAELPRDARAEFDEVHAGAAGSMRFRGERAADWADAKPRGVYAREGRGLDFPGLFRATVYLRRYLEQWPEAHREAWRAAAVACMATGAAREAGPCDTAMAQLFGAEPLAAAVPAIIRPRDVRRLREAHAPRAPWIALQDVLRFADAPRPASVRDAVLALTHLLALQTAGDALFGELRAAQWQAKWLDAATFAYVGLREIDSILLPGPGIPEERRGPKVIVEPLPEVWAALQRIDRRLTAVSAVLRGNGAQARRSWLDDVVDGLAVQQRGEELPADLEKRLFEKLVHGFDEVDGVLGVPSQVEGIDGKLRRAVPRLVRVPIRWRGEAKTALALRLYVEHETAPGVWAPPPWGIALDAEAAAKAFATPR